MTGTTIPPCGSSVKGVALTAPVVAGTVDINKRHNTIRIDTSPGWGGVSMSEHGQVVRTG